MSNEYLNGYSYPIVKILYVGGGEVETINLSLCMEGGLVEEYEYDNKTVILEKNSRRVDYDFRGITKKYILDYSSYIKKGDLLNIAKIFNYNADPETYVIRLIPRADLPERYDDVRINKGFSQGIQPGGLYSPGHKLPIIEFISTQPGLLSFIDPAAIRSFRSPYYIAGA